MKNPGIIVRMADGLRIIVYNDQPLLTPKGKVILNLVDQSDNLLLNDVGKPRILLLDVEVYNEEMQA